jgi:hypothetical protein
MRTVHRVGLLCAVLAFAACGGGDGRVAVSGAFPGAACPPGAARWSADRGGYQRTAAFGEGEADTLLSVAGIAAVGGRVYVLDGAAGVVRVLDDSLRPIASIGRPGRGPGEFVRATMPTSHGGTQRWIAVQGDTLAVFDGERVSFFRVDGTVLATWNPDRVHGASPMQSRIAHAGGELFFTAGGYDPAAERMGQDFEIHATRGVDPRPVARIALPKLPGSVPMLSSEQARPRWDVRERCVVLSDGTSPWLVRVDGQTGAADTMALPLPDRDPPPVPDEERMASRQAGSRRGPGAPSALLRVRDLVMDPDGEVWVRPVQPVPALEGIEVLRLSPSTGAAKTDTVPAFPRAFGGPGVFYAVEASPDGVPVIVRYESAHESRRIQPR